MVGQQKQWALLSVALGLWLIAVSLTFAHDSMHMTVSDLISGAVLIYFGIVSLAPDRHWSSWGIAIVGLWLQFAPLVFWAPQALTYVNDTLVGALLIVLAFQLYKEPGIKESKKNHCPEGWSFNPSTWACRLLTVGLGMLCWSFARYMAAYQLGYIDHIWDPIFNDGTLKVITSDISHDFPVSDAGLGAAGYTLESILGWQGSQRRWYTMPWLVILFGFLVVPVSAVSIILIILQPVAVGAWCGWCLATAVCMLLMIVFTAHEFVASIQLLRQSVKAGRSFWQVFWKGGEPPLGFTLVKPRERAQGTMGWGITIPWNLVLSAFLGAWMMMAPSVFGMIGPLATGNFIIGPLVITCAIIAMTEVFRSLRFANIMLGLGLAITPWIWPEESLIANGNNLIVGLGVMMLSLRQGKISERYGDWDRLIK